ncbi:uncharacterized protein LOC124161100 [Ischnura elegans]|uniref:uncharacterized protein LOC124161100 n=1 Tax=Ischnura elegans TaxID=197161 RepID=UPI001ED870B2|nr:uncharacterized protein LOC124161100 [Ischnura elegans]
MRRSKGYTADQVVRILELLQDAPEDCSEAEDDPVVVYDGGVDAEEDSEESLTEDSSEDTGNEGEEYVPYQPPTTRTLRRGRGPLIQPPVDQVASTVPARGTGSPCNCPGPLPWCSGPSRTWGWRCCSRTC